MDVLISWLFLSVVLVGVVLYVFYRLPRI